MKNYFIVIFLLARVIILGQEDTIQVPGFCISDKYAGFLLQSDSLLRNAFVFRVEAPEKIVALTFDDGPSHLTPNLLKTLRELRCPATFFLLAENLTKTQAAWYYDTLFTLGIHGFTHVRINETSSDTLITEFNQAVNRFKSLYIPPVYYRPTFGGFNAEVVEQMKKHKLRGILWNIDSYDWNGYTVDSLVNRVIGNISPGSIILFHEKTSPEDIASVIIELRSAGYRIVVLDELLKYPAVAPGWE